MVDSLMSEYPWNEKNSTSENSIGIGFGTILSLRLFLITFATQKEMALHLFKIWLNARLLFYLLVAQAKKDKNDVTDSISKFFMHNCKCPKWLLPMEVCSWKMLGM